MNNITCFLTIAATLFSTEIPAELSSSYAFMKPTLLILFAISGILLIACLIATIASIVRKRGKGQGTKQSTQSKNGANYFFHFLSP